DFPQNYLYFSGMEYHLHALSLGWTYTLLAVTSQQLEHGLARYLTDILSSLAEYLVSTSHNELSQAEVPEDAVDTGELVEVIQRAQGRRLNLQEIDDYWDSVTNQHDEGESGETGSLSYDQARKLGLGPQE
ncbi:MAG: hypothetical protein ACWGO1_07700, partial [Anaerolineales bacterium]